MRQVSKEGILSLESWEIHKLPYSECLNCKKQLNRKRELRLFEDLWIHAEMGGGEYYLPDQSVCNNPEPLPCQKCGALIDYKTTNVRYYDFQCLNCIANSKKGDKIGIITMELREMLERGVHPHLKYGTSCSVVITPRGIFFEDIN